jgi:hypothetical protein
MVIQYYLKNARKDAVNLVITDFRGTEVARLRGGMSAGINTVVWNMRVDTGSAGARPGGGRGGFSPDQWQPLGSYLVTIDVDGQKLSQPARITKTQGWSVGASFPTTIRN